MKKFTKLFLSCAAVAAVTAAVATSAMAAEKTLTATYNEPAEGATTTTVTIQCDSKDDLKTLLILKPGVDRTSITDPQNQILQIDQTGTIATATVPVLDEETDKGTYKVYMGGSSGDIYVGSFSIGGTEILVGDADGNTRITPNDSVVILQYIAGDKTKISDENFDKAAYADGNTRITPNDSVEILKYIAGDKNRDHVGKTETIAQ